MLRLKRNKKKSSKSKRPYRPTLLVDFDGVIHSYTSGWQGVDVIPDYPVMKKWKRKGTKFAYDSVQWLEDLVRSDNFKVCIYSSRSKDPKGVIAMKEWLLKFQIDEDILVQISFPTTKPAAFLTIDYRAIQFKGEFIPAHELAKFKTWQRK
jgi:hypothetical protein